MATIHIKEIMSILKERGHEDAVHFGTGGFFLELSFEDKSYTTVAVNREAIDQDYVNKALAVDSAFGNVLILFDEAGLLKSIEVS